MYRFDLIEIDPDRYELKNAGQRVSIEPKVFGLLLHFVQNSDRVFSRDELIDAVWQGRIVSDATVSGAIKSLRKAIGDSGSAQKYVRTVHGRGFSFSASLEVGEKASSVTTAKPSASTHTSPVQGPVLLILPVTVNEGAAEFADLAYDLVEDLERIFTRISLLRISAQSARFADPARRPTARTIYDEIGAHFILDMSVRRRGGDIRVNVQLSNARAGIHLWAEQVAVATNVDELLDVLVNAVVGRIEPQLNRALYNLVRDIGDGQTARQLFLEASSLMALKGWRESTFLEAAELLRRSVAMEPEFAHAWAYLALILAFGFRVGVITDREASVREAAGAAERALELDSMDSTVLGFSGCALCDIGKFSRGMPVLKNALNRNPANGQAWVAIGASYLAQGDVEAAIKHLTHGIQISPLDGRLSVWGALLALAYLIARDYLQAALQAEQASEYDHKTYLPWLMLAAVRLKQQDLSAAQSAVDSAYSVKPDLSEAEITGFVGSKIALHVLELHRQSG